MTMSDLRERFDAGLIARFVEESGYVSLRDMAKDYALRQLFEMLQRAEDASASW